MITKSYKWENLLGDKDAVLLRIDKIEMFSNMCGSVPTIYFLSNDTGTIYNQFKIKNIQKPSYSYSSKSIDAMRILAMDLQRMEDYGIAHGDINSKNIICSYGKYFIIDFEPSLKQLINGEITLMTTIPYIAFDDIDADEITTKSDKIGFYYFVKKSIGKFSTDDFSKVFNLRMKNRINTLPVNESDINEYSFQDILDMAIKDKS